MVMANGKFPNIIKDSIQLIETADHISQHIAELTRLFGDIFPEHMPYSGLFRIVFGKIFHQLVEQQVLISPRIFVRVGFDR
jgi:hypothetical protein